MTDRDSAGHKTSLEWLVKNDPAWAVREIERLREALEWISGACDVSGRCKCGRPNGIPAIKSRADRALA